MNVAVNGVIAVQHPPTAVLDVNKTVVVVLLLLPPLLLLETKVVVDRALTLVTVNQSPPRGTAPSTGRKDRASLDLAEPTAKIILLVSPHKTPATSLAEAPSVYTKDRLVVRAGN